MAPIIMEMKKKASFKPVICVTAQHREMLDQVMKVFRLTSDYDLNIMKKDQTLYDITVNVLMGMKDILKDVKPDLVIVQGDTTTTFVASLAAFYEKIPVAHVEAGLRSFNKYSPFPEEINRVLTSHIADIHFAPTNLAKKNLINEGIPEENILVTGNTVIDSLFYIRNKFVREKIDFNPGSNGKKKILVTGHRRENFGEPFRNLCNALKEIAMEYPDVEIIYPVHLNPNVRKPVFEILSGFSNIKLIDPVDYIEFINLMSEAYLILTDSGGVQEEAPSFNVPIIVTRDTTERPEGVDAGVAVLVGTDKLKIITEVKKFLDSDEYYSTVSQKPNPYGDGKAAERIVQYLENTYFI